MNVYRRKRTQPLKWLVALIILFLALGVTFTDVYGYGGDGSATTTGDNNDPGERINSGSVDLASGDETGTGDTPSAVPEPSTLILLAGGLSALYMARRRKNSNR